MRVANRLSTSLLGAVVGALIPMAGWAQAEPGPEREPGTIQQVDLRSGGTLYGVVVGSGDPVRLVTGAGDTIDIPGASIERIRDRSGGMVEGRYFRRDPNETRLFFGPTARTLPAGDTYIGIFELYLPFLAYGVTDRITIAGGMPLLVGGDMPLVLYLAPKIQLVSAEGFSAAVGSLSFLVEDESAGVLYAVATVESADGRSSFTGGGGWGYLNTEVSDSPVLMAGGDLQISRSVKLLSENYFFPGEGFSLVSGGFRFIGENLSADVGLAFPSGAGIGLPLVNFVWSF